jgi:hypothetical protein
MGVWRPHPSLAVAGIALVLAGVALAAASWILAAGKPAWRHADEREVSEGAGDVADISAHNSPTLARNPRAPEQLAVSSRIDSPRFSCALHVSSDGGEGWRRTAVPIPSGEERKCYAPDVAFGADGTLHLVYVTLRGAGNVPNAVWVSSSRDGGRTLDRPVRVSGPRAFQVRIAADPARPGRLYAAWLQAREVGPLRFTDAGNPIVVARSDDGGRTWGRPTRVNAPSRARVLAPTPLVGREGELFVLFVDLRGDRLDYLGGHDGLGGPPYRGRFSLVLGRSRDGGRRWEESVVDDRVAPIARFVPFLPAFPALAIERRTGRLFAAFHDARQGSADVLVWTLDPGAGRWRGPAGVDDAATTRRTAQYLPQVAVAPDGRLDVLYYDRRGDRRDRRNAVSLQSSWDAGRTFGPRLRVSRRSFDARIGFGSERGMPDLGSRLGLLGGDSGALAVWSDTRHGTDASNKQDLVGAALELERAGGDGERALREIGLAVAAGGLAALGLALARRRSRTARSG